MYLAACRASEGGSLEITWLPRLALSCCLHVASKACDCAHYADRVRLRRSSGENILLGLHYAQD
jgi:hypothetical protein